MSRSSETLQRYYPWTKQPLITNGPMGQLIGPDLVAEVTRAGGIGFLGAGYTLAENVEAARKTLSETRAKIAELSIPGLPADGTLPVGLGVLTFTVDVSVFVELVREFKPAAVWLFGAHDEADYAAWASRIRAVGNTHVWIQTNSVASALNLARSVSPDVLVLQGSDAGGHGTVQGAGIVSLVPEAADTLASAGFGKIPLVAAGGIADGRGAAAALTLGASGVTLGTRFLLCDELANASKGYQKALLEAKDGGQSTVRSKAFDDVRFADGNIWPVHYDGRALINATIKDIEKGVDIEERRKLFAQDAKTDGGYRDAILDSRAIAWTGTAVGLVNKIEPAAKIVTDTREGALRILNNAWPAL